jgi:hypothetical protein
MLLNISYWLDTIATYTLKYKHNNRQQPGTGNKLRRTQEKEKTGKQGKQGHAKYAFPYSCKREKREKRDMQNMHFERSGPPV